jgi:hypothetical protein
MHSGFPFWRGGRVPKLVSADDGPGLQQIGQTTQIDGEFPPQGEDTLACHDDR